jgi:GTP-binding nuclear protein Ran
MASQTNQKVKIVFIGNGGCGKTSYLNMVRTGKFESKYIPTIGVKVHLIQIDGMTFNCWDCAGQERFGGLQEAYYIGAHTIMICFTESSKSEVKNIPIWLKMARDTLPDVKIILVGMKNDLPQAKGMKELIQKHRLPFCSVSGKSVFELPFQMVRDSM